MLSFLYVYSDHSILECYNLFSGVELSMRSFLLLLLLLLLLDVCNNKLGLNLTQETIDRSHHLGSVHEARIEQGNEVTPSPRPIIVKFTNYHNRSTVFSS